MTDETNTGYTGADLRRARRKARKLGLNPANGKQAIEMLLEHDIDITTEEITPLDANKAAAIKPSEARSGAPAQQTEADQGSLGGTALIPNAPKQTLALQRSSGNAPAVISQEQRLLEVAKLEAKIKKRRESKIRALVRRLTVYVILPTVIVGIYFAYFATPYYAAETEMKVDSPSLPSGGGVGGLLSGGILGDQSEPIQIQGYLKSRQAFQKLEERYGFTDIYKAEDIDRFRQITEESTLEEKYGVYKDQVRITYDSTDMTLRMEVRSPDPESAIEISDHLIDLAEENLDQTTRVVREATVQDAEDIVRIKADIIKDIEGHILKLQEEQKSLSPIAEKEVQIGIIGELEAQKSQYQQQLDSLLANQQPNQARVNGLREQIRLVERQISNITQSATTSEDGEQSTAQLDLAMRFAETDLAAAQSSYQLALESLQNAQSQVRSQRKYLTTSLSPTVTFEPKYPKTFLNTFAAFLIFFGIYVFVSITVEVIREQVSA